MQIYRPNITFFETDEMMYNHATDYVSDILLDVSGNEGSAKMAVSGGSTPMKLYTNLSNNPVLPWEDIELYQVDERYVAEDSPLNNKKQIISAFGEETVDRMKYSYFFDTSKELADSLNAYADVLDSFDGSFFDVTILGIGGDGHFASLFPGGNYLQHMETSVIPTMAGEGFDVNQRLSLTIESVLSSETIIVLLKGEDKQHIVHELLEGKKSAVDFPAKFLLSHPNLHIMQSMEDIEQ